MNISIKEFLQKNGIEGDIILYRDKKHKKAEMCQYLASHVKATGQPICVYTGGAYGLYMAKAFAPQKVVICGKFITDEYASQIEKLANAELVRDEYLTKPYVGGVQTPAVRAYAEAKDYQFINQFDEPLVPQFYKEHFADIAAELADKQIDAFCDCGHSCATLAGYLDSGLKWKAILGVNDPSGKRQVLNHLAGREEEFENVPTSSFDTAEIRKGIERSYPSFGNVFEATRSISAAMKWLQDNPGKTVLVYVGDSPIYGQDATLEAV